jgi:hypothetical protein
MLENLIFEKGEIKEILINDNIDLIKKSFASMYSGNYHDINSFLINSLKIQRVKEAEIKIKILLALNLLLTKERKKSVEILNQLGIPNLKSIEGWLPDYFLSIWKMLVLYLKVEPSLSHDTKINENQKLYIIGDSHLIGMSVSSLRFFTNFSYIPGLRYSILSSPQNNLKIEGLRNSFLFSYPYQKIIISIGEIDTRMAFLKANENELFIPEILHNFKYQVDDSLILIDELKLKSQNITLIIPPHPKEQEFESNTSLNCAKLINEMCNYVENSATQKGFKTLKYPESIKKNEYFNSNKNYIDHAHFNASVYFDIFQKSKA